MFHELVSTWFSRRFGEPSPVQVLAWPEIAKGHDALIAAPTGAGKTLAAFLYCLDRLVRASASGELTDRTEVVYVSPLRALSNDVQRNLEAPLAELGALADELGLARPAVRTAVRTGDSSQKARRDIVKKPPHVLVTTPESLFLLLTSESGRKQLASVRTVILDEIHALAGDKRGCHLALSVERLENLVVSRGGARPQRIGLSATMKPIDVAARLLVGSSAPMPAIVDVGQRRDIDLGVLVPKDELGAVSTNEQWVELYDRVADLVRSHRQTLVFVNTRRLAERVTHALGERLGEEAVAAHHGSLSRARRFSAEQRLKQGDLKVVVATASLELGIDVGAVDLTCVIGSPRRIATALQRIGRSGHMLGATPKGRFFPLTRDQLIECAAIVKAARAGVMDAIALRDAPLDVLAQQIVAHTAAEECDEDAVFDLVRRAAPYADLGREKFDAVIQVLAEGIATRRGRAGALVHRDAVNKRLRGRRGARLAALTSGGAIPDNANYDVLLHDDATKVGTLEEDFAIESMAGDVFLLGNTSWRIRRVEMGKVWVEDAKGAAPTIPFWLGESPSRSPELSRAVADLRADVARIREEDGTDAAAKYLVESCALDRAGAELASDYVATAIAALGALPTERTLVAERFFDESGGMQLVLHAPFGAGINRAIGLLLRKRFCRTFDFELQAAATDDGVLLSLGPQHSFPLEAIRELLRPERLREVLEQAALQAPVFGTRFRWNATRFLALLRFRNGKRVPPPLLRMRSDDLLSAIFPAQQGCQDNHAGQGPIEVPDHPLVEETLRDCLCEWMNADGAKRVLEALASGEIGFSCRETTEPSVLSHEILNANPYAFLDDAPLEERRARAVSVRRGLPAEITDRVGGLDPQAIAQVTKDAQPEVRDHDELHDLLLEVGGLPEADGQARAWVPLFAELVMSRRAARLVRAGSSVAFWVAAERRSLALAAWPDRSLEPDLAEPGGPREMPREDALASVVRGRLAHAGPTTAAELAAALDIDAIDIDIALARVELDGGALRGRFRPNASGVEWCDRRLLARIHRATTDGLRRAIEPVSTADLLRFLFAWQGVRGARAGRDLPSPPAGRVGLLRVLEQLQGFELAAGAWEEHVLPARLADYHASWLDELCLSGEIAWGRFSPRERGTTPTRAALVTFGKRTELSWLLALPEGETPVDDSELSEAARHVLAILGDGGAAFFDDLVHASARHRGGVEDALWELVAAGRVTGDGFSGLRALIAKANAETLRIGRYRAPLAPVMAGRWALLRGRRAGVSTEMLNDAAVEAMARQYLRRYGVVFRDLLTREPRAPSWRDLLRVYRTLEMRGEIRGGRLVAGFVGEQFALPIALDALRAVRREPLRGEVVELSACDPLNLVGIVTPGPRVPAHLGNKVRYRDGVVETDGPLLLERRAEAISSFQTGS